jgi:hypothetical protein
MSYRGNNIWGGNIMEWKFEIKAPLAWADSYEDAEDYDDELDDDDETVQHLTAAHNLWMDMLKSWAGAGGCPQLEVADSDNTRFCT